MESICLSKPTSANDEDTSLMGLAHLMTLAFEGSDLMPVATRLIERASTNLDDANALMDLSTVLLLQGIRNEGLATQAHALQVSRLYELPARKEPAVRLLAIMAPGDLMTNTPLAFLIDGSDIALSTLYLKAGEPIPSELPEHDLLFIAVSESDPTRALLEQLDEAWNKPVFNQAARILRTSRVQACALLKDTPGIFMPASARCTRAELQALATGRLALDGILPEGAFPLIVRPVDSHAGHGLEKADEADAIASYLERSRADEFFVSRFIDYRSPDGLFRKYRVVLIDGRPYAGHMGISEHWMIHYLNAGMTESAGKRAEEALFMQTFDAGFGRRHASAFLSIAERFGLDYLVIDCAETASGDLLVFEVDPGAVVHAMDPMDLFPYKHPQMQKVFNAFRAMLTRACARPTSLREAA